MNIYIHSGNHALVQGEKILEDTHIHTYMHTYIHSGNHGLVLGDKILEDTQIVLGPVVVSIHTHEHTYI